MTALRISAIFLFAALSFPAAAQDSNLSITWIGQSCFLIQTRGGPAVLTDPPAPSIGYALPAVSPDAVIITHNHTDHNNAAGVPGAFTLIDGRPTTARQEMAAGSLKFVLIPGFHDNMNGSLRGPNTMMRWTQAGLNIVHLGDLGQDLLTLTQLIDLVGIDILFIPAGGFFTITPEQAAAYVDLLKPRVAILMHYKTALGGPAQLAGLPASAAPFANVVYKPANVVVNRATLPASTEVWVMQPQSDAAAVSAAGFTPGAPVAPGSIVSLFGPFTGSAISSAAYPLPRKLAETEAWIDGKAAPLYYVSPGQINLQVPAAQTPGQSLVEARVNGQTLARAPLTIVPNAPGLFAVANKDGRLNSAGAPARLGEILQIFGTGQGAVFPAVDDGTPAGQPSPATYGPPNVFLENRQLTVQSSALAAGVAGVWQINAVIPADAPVGSALSLVVIQGLISNRIAVAVSQ
jgi:uncharacterized protein (TIGR03437 family)